MRIPKRSPFLHSRQTELLEVYRHLYPESTFLPSSTSSPSDRHRALSTIQLWINRSACPFAVETTASLVQSIVLDEHMQHLAASTPFEGEGASSSSRHNGALEQMGGGAELGVRINYGMTITRFVNSIVDSYQTGGFAQSIAAIAARIGLPTWFVEIRHAATHEELPSLKVCRQAARAALEWLHEHFWIPQLFLGPASVQFSDQAPEEIAQMDLSRDQQLAAASSSAVIQEDRMGLDDGAQNTDEAAEGNNDQQRTEERDSAICDVRLVLRSYRELSKKVIRDRNLARDARDEIRACCRRVSAFVNKRRSAHPAFADEIMAMAAGRRKRGRDEEQESPSQQDPDEADECLRSALNELINELVRPGGLIPLSKTKRVKASAVGDEIVLPPEVAAIWAPLLGYLRDTFGFVFGLLLVEELLRAVCTTSNSSASQLEDDSMALNPSIGASVGDEDIQSIWKEKTYSQESYRKTAEAWIRYLVTVAPPSSVISLSGSTANLGVTLATETDVAERCLLSPSPTPGSTSLLSFLCEKDSDLQARIEPLVQVLRASLSLSSQPDQLPTPQEQRPQLQLDNAPRHEEAPSTQASTVETPTGFEFHLKEMQQRLEQVKALEPIVLTQASASMPVAPAVQVEEPAINEEFTSESANQRETQKKTAAAEGLPAGWSYASEDWTPTPFGCIDGRLPDLLLTA